MSKNRFNRNNDNSIFELLSDISLSTLGLFLIFFVVYSVSFNSSFVDKVNDLNNQIKQLTQDKSRLNYENSQLTEDKSRLASDNDRLTNELNKANQRADNAEKEKQYEITKNQYTGYYKGQNKSQFYYNGCYNDYYTIQTEEILIYLQASNTIIYSSKSEKGTITYQMNGYLQGNTFRGKFSSYSRTENIESCDKYDGEQVINFFDNYLEMYNSKDSSQKLILRKID